LVGNGSASLDVAPDVILNDLYEDPRQGAGLWLFEDELQLADRLGEELHNAVVMWYQSMGAL
jgi:hypothetical protein